MAYPWTGGIMILNVTSEEWIVRGAALRGGRARDAARARSAEELKCVARSAENGH